ncbi:hypothetical protein H072_10804 [Dactylellina haptotyla CBS 200.50]|uniref:Uncharacterized protein n=1 Tax=Dactylellina haptotyla (strain CBS 200.50) TaxID=1284197 RepID=S7ZYB6_DACHA|nr:hypothetical protein H072_10804 [Dactylellina haptotyla CBS 200.50]
MSTQLTEVQKDLLRDLGQNWISMFMSGHLSLGDIEGKEQEVLNIMENLSTFIVGVLCCHMWNETGRFTMLCRTRLNDFMLLHGIDGLWQERQGYPFVIFGATKFGFVYRKNNVIEWQRLHQRHDGLRTWTKGPRSKMMIYPYFVILGAGFAGMFLSPA